MTTVFGLAPVAAGAAASHSPVHVESRTYELGARAFVVHGLQNGKNHDGPMELTGRVFYPSNVATGSHPLVLMMHGYWPTCADPKSEAIYNDPNSSHAAFIRAATLLNQWPCAKGTPPLPSYRGYDYLGRMLAAQGNVVVSIGANGANAIDSYHFQGDAARPALIGKHLRMWERFVNADKGPLRSVLPSLLVHHVNMRKVGLLGHSRAGRAVLEYASDGYRSRWPAGVTIRAVLGLAPAGGDPSVSYRTTTMPVGLIYGTCDDIKPTRDYYPPSAAHSKHAVYQWQIHGANHDYWNTQWSPSSGQVGAYNDAYNDPQNPGHCADGYTEDDSTSPPAVRPHYVRELKEDQQRHYGLVYVGDFFARALQGTHRFDAVLDGRRPLPAVTTTTNLPSARRP